LFSEEVAFLTLKSFDFSPGWEITEHDGVENAS
ncbi:hypothetical protein L195_g061447, partial [Trifolium pratense]